MTIRDFIFSNSLIHRLVRHASFWFIWWMYFLATYYYPTFQFKGWDLGGANWIIKHFGYFYFIKKTLIINTLVPVVLPQALFTYCIISFALPRYFGKKNQIAITTLLFLGLMILIYMIAISLMYVPFYHNYKLGIRTNIPSISETIPFINKTYLFNLPIVAGFAVMIKQIKQWLLKQEETEQMIREKTKAELQLLKAQVHPHFLFNTLNNIYFYTLNSSPQAPEMIKKLTSLLQYIIYECNQPLVSLKKELKMLQDYFDLEKIRYGEKLEITFEIDGNFQEIKVAPLLLIPFVENSFKHGASKMINKSWIKLRINLEYNELHFFITNCKPAAPELFSTKGGIGIKNVMKRLQLLYPRTHELNIISEEESFTVFLKIKLNESSESEKVNSKTINKAGYAFA